jgi:hypothetical protein
VRATAGMRGTRKNVRRNTSRRQQQIEPQIVAFRRLLWGQSRHTLVSQRGRNLCGIRTYLLSCASLVCWIDTPSPGMAMYICWSRV